MQLRAPQRAAGRAAGVLLAEQSEHGAARAGHCGTFRTAGKQSALDVLDACALFVREYLLKDVFDARAQRRRVARFQRGEHRRRVGSIGQRHAVRPLKERGRRDGKVRLADRGIEPRRVFQHGQPLAPALCQLRAAADAERYVATDTRADLLEPLVRERRCDQIAQRAQHGGGIRAAARHPGLGRDALGKRDVDAAVIAERLAEGVRRLDGKVAFVARKLCARDAADDACAVGERHGHIVAERNGLHDHPQLVIAVRALA